MNATAPRAAAIQMTSRADRDANLATARRLLEQAAAAGSRLAALPENFAYMGVKDTDKLALGEADGPGDDRPIQSMLATTARELGLWIVAGTVPLAVEGDAARVWPACLVYDEQGQRVARYDKIHLFDVTVPGGESYRESATMSGGDAAQAIVVDTPVGRLGLSICYDLRFPELYRRLVIAGAQVLCVPAAFTARTGEAHWQMLLRARAVENQCHVLAPAQWGTHDSGRQTWGHSMIIDPWGEILAEQAEGEGAAVAAIDPTRLAQVRSSFPSLTHRRIEA
jgi:nitrilase